MAGFGNGSHRLKKISADLRPCGLATAFVDSSPVLQAKILVVAKEIGGAHCTIGCCDFLCLIQEIGEGIAELIGDPFHVLKAVLWIFDRIVGHDGDAADARGL